MAKKLKSIFSKIFMAIFVMALLAALLLNFSTLMSVNKIKSGGLVKSGYACAVINSGSMYPTISVNDLLIIKGAEFYKEGDIVTYISDSGAMVTHRVVSVSKDGYITQGDANNVADKKIDRQRILGKVVFVAADFGGIVKWIVLPLIIVFIACVFLLPWVLNKLKEDKA
jgi:signal peptidase I, archaeal type